MTSGLSSQDEKLGPVPDKPSPDCIRAALTGLLPELRGFARFLVRERSEADDLVQEALLRALRALDQFRPRNDARRDLRAWVFAILRHAHIEQARRRRTEAAALAIHGPDEELIGPAQHGNADLVDLQRHLWALSPVLREALILVGAQGLDYEEAAQVCAVPVGTMKARVARARRQLAASLDSEGVPPAFAQS